MMFVSPPYKRKVNEALIKSVPIEMLPHFRERTKLLQFCFIYAHKGQIGSDPGSHVLQWIDVI